MGYGGFSGAGGSTKLSINRQDGDYVLEASDAGGVVFFGGGVDATYTLPSGEFQVGDVVTIEVGWVAEGLLTVVPAGGVELSLCAAGSPGPAAAIAQTDRPARLVLVMVDADVWDAAGANFE